MQSRGVVQPVFMRGEAEAVASRPHLEIAARLRWLPKIAMR
jgi:hypothetical protein